METELEAKFLDVNPDKLRLLLKQNGATLVHPERLMRRKNFDYSDRRLEKIGGWVRVRDEGDKVTLSFKQIFDRTIEGTKEISLKVEDFEKMDEFLAVVGFECKSYQETKRERWDFNGVEVTIDTWPWIPTLVELEGKSADELKAAAEKLQLDWKKALHGSVENAYQAYYDISEDEINNCKLTTFVPVPDWLMARKK
jgi:adenylate cyclase class 2